VNPIDCTECDRVLDRINRISWIFHSWLSACPPPARNASQREAGGDESQEIAIAFGEYMKIKFQKKIMMILLILSDINCLQKRTMNS
jgi:hypothetical protein